MGEMLLVIRKPASMLPTARRFSGFSRVGLFSLILIELEKRGCPVSVKMIVRVL